MRDDSVDTLHRAIDMAVAPLEQLHGERLVCREGCSSCCVDDITVFEVEAEVIRRHHPEVLSSDPHPEGACAFLDEKGACRIYAHRPYVCRTQGLPLRWLDEIDGQRVEVRDICPLNEEGPPLEELSAESCWTLGPAEQRLHQIQRGRGGPRRVRLRDLFAASRPSRPLP